MKTVNCALSVDASSLHVHGDYLRGKLTLKLGNDVLPAVPKEEHAALVLCGLMQVSNAILSGETERAPVVMEGSLAAVLVENGGKGRLDVMGFELAPKGGDSKQIGFWHVDAREFTKALIGGADQIMRVAIANEWENEDVSVLLHLSIVCKTWLDENKEGATPAPEH
ncbi:MAG: hypothetical protein KBG84_04950 [Planctomycetes bacterium]|nr:hypothetical protein [Planctomycetota bacterium]